MTNKYRRAAVFAIVTGVAATLYLGLLQSASQLTVSVGLTILLLGLGAYDQVRARAPNVITLPLLFAAFILALVRFAAGNIQWGEAAWIGATWLACFGLWGMRVVGAGDMKVVMAIIAIYPDNRLLLAIIGCTLVGTLATLVIRYRWTGLHRAQGILVASVVGHALPARVEVAAAYCRRSNPALIWISAGSLVYLWWIQ